MIFAVAPNDLMAFSFRTTLPLCSWFALLALFGCGDPPAANSSAATSHENVAPSTVRHGERIYHQSCASCHGAGGDGKGSVLLDRPARSFLSGGFSFGNTPEAIFRTISFGIGGTPMPGFASSLSVEEREAVAAYVLALGPEQIAVDSKTLAMQVTDRPQVIRGSFASIMTEGEIIPRGLLLGGLDGLSFQYDASDLRLLAVRQGDFVERRDWENRGGDPLLPLGKIVYLFGGDVTESMWSSGSASGQGQKALRAELRATEVIEGKAWVEYALLLNGQEIATVRETGEAFSLGGWSGFRRTFEGVRKEEENLPPFLVWPHHHRVEEIFPKLPGEILLFEDSSKNALVVRSLIHNPELDSNTFSFTTDYLFGLEPTPENLLALQEAMQ